MSSALVSARTRYQAAGRRVTPPSLPRPALSEGIPIDPIAPEVNLGDLPSVLDVVERVGVEHDEIGAHSRLEGADVNQTERLR